MELPKDISLDFEQISNESEEFMRFLEHWSEDLESYFPDFSIYDTTFATAYILKINSQPSGMFIYQDKGEELHIDLDYLIPEYRDMGIGNAFFAEKLKDFEKAGFSVIISVTENPKHIKYLKELGFSRSDLHDARFELRV